jgi:ubiquinone/menaquinone biosynthesis C-methylase UbiE
MVEKLPDSGAIWNKKFAKGWGEERPPEARLLEFMEKYKEEIGPDILDIGSGDGRHLIPLAKAGYNLTGFELTEEGINKTKEKLDKEKIKAELVKGNFHNLPFQDNVYDTVISLQAMQHNNWPGAEAAFAEAVRVLRPGGLFFLRVNSDKNALQDNQKKIADKGRTTVRVEEGHLGYHHSFSLEELKELADKYNLEIEPGYTDEKRAGNKEGADDNFVILGQWNIIFRKKSEEN